MRRAPGCRRDVGAAEAIDRLLGVADQEQRAGPDLERGPIVAVRQPAGSPHRRQKISVCKRVGVLELVDQDMREALPPARGAPRHGRAAGRARRRSDRRSRAAQPSACGRESDRITGCARSNELGQDARWPPPARARSKLRSRRCSGLRRRRSSDRHRPWRGPRAWPRRTICFLLIGAKAPAVRAEIGMRDARPEAAPDPQAARRIEAGRQRLSAISANRVAIVGGLRFIDRGRAHESRESRLPPAGRSSDERFQRRAGRLDERAAAAQMARRSCGSAPTVSAGSCSTISARSPPCVAGRAAPAASFRRSRAKARSAWLRSITTAPGSMSASTG